MPSDIKVGDNVSVKKEGKQLVVQKQGQEQGQKQSKGLNRG